MAYPEGFGHAWHRDWDMEVMEYNQVSTMIKPTATTALETMPGSDLKAGLSNRPTTAVVRSLEIIKNAPPPGHRPVHTGLLSCSK